MVQRRGQLAEARVDAVDRGGLRLLPADPGEGDHVARAAAAPARSAGLSATQVAVLADVVDSVVEHRGAARIQQDAGPLPGGAATSSIPSITTIAAVAGLGIGAAGVATVTTRGPVAPTPERPGDDIVRYRGRGVADIDTEGSGAPVARSTPATVATRAAVPGLVERREPILTVRAGRGGRGGDETLGTFREAASCVLAVARGL